MDVCKWLLFGSAGVLAKNIYKSSSLGLAKRLAVLSLSTRKKKEKKEKKRKLSVAERWGKKEGVLKESLQVINTSSRFISGDISLLTIITYFWAIQRGLQYFYGPFL